MPAYARYSDPPRDCAACPRLAGFRADNRAKFPDWHNAPVPAFGALDARLLIVGLAPGLRGANLTGRPFTGDYAGDLLYATLARHGLAAGTYGKVAADGFRLVDARVTNAVRCVPPENKPTGQEIKACNPFLGAEIAAMPNLRVLVALGAVSHGAILSTQKVRKAAFPFRHGAAHELSPRIRLFDSYHCSRYNTNTGRLTESMFDRVFQDVTAFLKAC